MIVGLLSLYLSVNTFASEDMQAISKTIFAFAKAGDENNADELANYLDENYRIVLNQLFGSETVSIMDRQTYLDKIRSKEFGGDKREVIIESITLNGNTAYVKVIMKGKMMTTISLIGLVKNKDGIWKLISDIPVIF